MIDFFNTTKDQCRSWLEYPYETRLEMSKDCIRQVLTVAKNPYIQFSGGIDSCVMFDIIYKIKPVIPVFNDWGLFLPEQEKFCQEFMSKYTMPLITVSSGVTWQDFLTKRGFPIFKGFKYIKEEDYKELNITKSCRSLKDKCWNTFYKNQTPDYYFVGMIHDESPQRKSLFIQHGFIIPKDKGILVKPIVLLKKSEVFRYAEENNVLYPKEYYKDTYNGRTISFSHCDMGCFICGIRFGEFGFGRIGRLARSRPDIFYKTMDLGLRKTLNHIITKYPFLEVDHIIQFLNEYDKPLKTGYDLDGVLCVMPKRPKPMMKQTGAQRKSYDFNKLKWFSETPCLWKPEKECYVITGRREKNRIPTEAWLQKHKIPYKELIMMEGSLTFDNILNHKVKSIKKVGIERYFEDDDKLATAIQKACPNVQVILVPRDTSSYKIIDDTVLNPLSI